MNDFKKLKLFFSIGWKISKSYIFLLIGNSFFSMLQILTNVVIPKYLIDELMGARDITMLIIFGGAIVVSNLIFALLTKTMKRFLDVKARYMDYKMTQYMGKKIMNVEYRLLEDPYYLDLKERALFAITNQGAMFQLINNVTSFMKNAITILSLMAIMLTLSVEFVVFLIITVGISIFIYWRFKKDQAEFHKNIIPINRKYGYYVNLCYNLEAQKDYRLYGMSDTVANKVCEFNKNIVENFKVLYKKQARLNAINSIITDFRTASVYGYVGIRVVSDALGGTIGLGSFTMYVSSAVSFAKSINDLLNSIITIRYMLDYLKPMVEFLSLPNESENEGDLILKDIESIEFSHVTFSYPKSNAIVLNDISFSIKKGQKISIVGLNGAGKTTLVKLICRLYKVDSGRILINGRDIYDYEYESYMDSIAAVFQDYKLFNYSITENITGKKKGDPRMEKIIDDVGLRTKIDKLEKGTDSLIGKNFDENGIEMSGGENQKLAIARSLYKDASLVILDEPTSALDPLAEADIYENFNMMVENKTALYISHRMSSSVFCDKILVIDGGKIVDFDTHANLLKKSDSLYTKLFNSQADNYRIDEA
ncbi:MAG: ABC transporter ATP-binding protein [Clostridia bacterium]